MYKKIAIATLIAAPLLAEFAARWESTPVAQPEPVAAIAQPPEPPKTTAPANRPAPMAYSAIPQTTSLTRAIDPTPTLDPSAVADLSEKNSAPQPMATDSPPPPPHVQPQDGPTPVLTSVPFQ
jgi:hypothetical protein